MLEAFWHGRVPFLAGSAGRLKGEAGLKQPLMPLFVRDLQSCSKAMAESVTALGFTITPEGSGCRILSLSNGKCWEMDSL